MDHRKDAILDELAKSGNVAQFVSFSPSTGGLDRLTQNYSRVAGHAPNHMFASPIEALEALLASSVDGTINLRSFAPDSPRSRAFHYGIASAAEALNLAEQLVDEDLFVIANETVDVADGGVSGVIQGDVVEFAPDDTPRCVEKPGTAALPFDMAMALLERVYGFRPVVGDPADARIEFSVHPKPRGWKRSQTLLWERERVETSAQAPRIRWPNRFSRHIGDKVFGLLVADMLGAPVPRTTVISRRVAPFSFGRDTASLEVWTRTAPREQQPGKYTTIKGWIDPFALMTREDPEQTAIASVLSQAAVPALHSGAAIVTADGELIVEGVVGEGDALMLGERLPEALSPDVSTKVRAIYEKLSAHLGPVRFEWVHDGAQIWIVQLHSGMSTSTSSELVPGTATHWRDFEVSKGLAELRTFLDTLDQHEGINLVGEVGLTSHVADLLRKVGRPARLAQV